VGCPHLTGRESDALPVAEAIDLGFTPCGLCRPVDRLLAARHA
jgi:clumping factor A